MYPWISLLFFLERLIVEYCGWVFKQTVDITAPLWEERSSPETLGVRFKRGPDIDEHVLSGLVYVPFHTRRDTFGMLANHFTPLEDRLSKFIFFSWDRLKNR